MTVIGYPATFINWKTAEASDYEWIRMEKTLTTADKDKIAAVIKSQVDGPFVRVHSENGLRIQRPEKPRWLDVYKRQPEYCLQFV